MPRDDEDLRVARLLSGRPDEPSVWEKEAAFEALARAAAPKPRAWAWGGAALAAAAALALAILPRDTPEFAARGGDPSAPSVALVCVAENRPAACTRTAELRFEIQGASPDAHVAAFAQDPQGTIIWYFPAASDRSAPVGQLGPAGLLDRSVRLATGHAAGAYRVFVVFSEEPLDRAALKRRLGPELAGDVGLKVARLPLTVLP
jgi:hypothetical protein